MENKIVHKQKSERYTMTMHAHYKSRKSDEIKQQILKNEKNYWKAWEKQDKNKRGDLNTDHVWISNSEQLFGCQTVQYSNDIWIST